ncbi:uncharacterized protein BP01DRAFT_151873 [Aspergillus saccharolyticus JOP 1030-1]|uniref:Uncharacterized protein n=1 Tax=Aspergillus saccharolyticus JOP 1030-1 TaxID=1450539 RepID=A0A318ZPN0_9EURO|nr:hypothetical protein BP01DRAFT_151873 [Aspergillus saccharolyticus JOP 1030-1]PYH48595.1 hypothetical protein BP01DRAFT_151873 [Aspergillus saccharolyticus JOP 1030-1]
MATINPPTQTLTTTSPASSATNSNPDSNPLNLAAAAAAAMAVTATTTATNPSTNSHFQHAADYQHQSGPFSSATNLPSHQTTDNYPHQITGPGGPTATAPFLRDFSLVAEAAKRAQMSVIMRDLESVTL